MDASNSLEAPKNQQWEDSGVECSQAGQGRGIHQQDAPPAPRVASHRLTSAGVCRLRCCLPSISATTMLEMTTQVDVGAQCSEDEHLNECERWCDPAMTKTQTHS